MTSQIPIIVQGNSFSLAIPLQIYYINGDQMDLQDYYPDPTDEISIQLKGDRRQYTYTPTVVDNVCTIALSGNELADNYSVVVSIVKANGQRLRSFRTDQFFIVESSDDLTPDDIIEGLEENVIYLNSSIFIAGEDGRGIESIEKTGTVGLVDTYTITYTDNTTSIFQVTNGANPSPVSLVTREYETDLSFIDENDFSIVDFVNGNVRTKNFDSTPVTPIFGKYKGKKISILGDSISTFGDPTSTNQNGTYCWSYYPTATCRYSLNGGGEGGSIQFDVNDTYWMRLITTLEATLGINESWRGTLVTGTDASAFNNQTRIDHLGQNGTPDLILVFGGTNDAGNLATIGTFNGGDFSDYNTAAKIAALDVSTFANAYKAMLIRLMFTYPTAEIVCILPTFTTSYYTIQKLDDYIEVIKEACDFFGIKWIDVRVADINIFNKANYLVDGIHPNAMGMQLLANKIYKHLIFD